MWHLTRWQSLAIRLSVMPPAALLTARMMNIQPGPMMLVLGVPMGIILIDGLIGLWIHRDKSN